MRMSEYSLFSDGALLQAASGYLRFELPIPTELKNEMIRRWIEDNENE